MGRVERWSEPQYLALTIINSDANPGIKEAIENTPEKRNVGFSTWRTMQNPAAWRRGRRSATCKGGVLHNALGHLSEPRRKLSLWRPMRTGSSR